MDIGIYAIIMKISTDKNPRSEDLDKWGCVGGGSN